MAKGDSHPKPPQQCQLNVGITNGDGAVVTIITDNDGTFSGVEDLPNNPGRYSISIHAGFGTGSSINISKQNYDTINHRLQDMNDNPLAIPLSGSVEIKSEVLVKTKPVVTWPPITAFKIADILPFDPDDDPNNLVHTFPPPELVFPSAPSKRFFRGDIAGVTTPLAPPFVDGANTTPPNMWMSYLLPKYRGLKMPDGTDCIEYYLNFYANVRGYTHLHLDRWQWDRAGYSIPDIIDLMKKIISYGLFISYWATGTGDNRSVGWDGGVKDLIAPILEAIIAAGIQDKVIVFVGEELNSGCVPGDAPNGIDGIINGTCALANPVDIPVYLHFTSNVPAWPASGIFPDWIAQFTGNKPGYGKIKGIGWQANQNDAAGHMGAHMYDTRRYYAAAGGLDMDVIVFETLATNNLYGKASEIDNVRRGWELNCCPINPQDAGRMNPTWGFCNGGLILPE